MKAMNAQRVCERDVEAYLVKRVKDHGGIAYKFTSPQRRSMPDRLVLLPQGYAAFAELKSPGKRPTVPQLREHHRLRKLGFEVALLDQKIKIDSWLQSVVHD